MNAFLQGAALIAGMMVLIALSLRLFIQIEEDGGEADVSGRWFWPALLLSSLLIAGMLV